MLRSGEISSYGLTLAYFNRIEQINPQLNAIIALNKENALNEAKQADLALKHNEELGFLHGIPITIKDNIEVEMIASTAGYKPFKNHISTNDSELVSLLKKAGAIVIGKTNLPALTYDLQTNNQLFGRTNNPWNINHTPGGSSGGCAAAVSSGMSPISFCNDSGGSSRIPAHFCGVYGFKSSFGGINPKGIITQVQKKLGQLKMRTLLSAGMIAQSVDNIKVGLSIVGTNKLIPAHRKEVPATSLKLLWIDELPGFEVDHEIKQSLITLHSQFTKSGVKIDNFSSKQFDFLEAIRMWGHLSNYETGNELPAIARSVGHLIMRRKYAKIPMHTDLLKPINSSKYRVLRKRHEELKKQFEALLESYDGLIIPASSVLAFPHQKPDRKIGHLGIYTTPLAVNNKKVQYAIAVQSYALPFNVLESPIVSLPIALSKNGLPIGVQLVGKKNSDFDLLEVAISLVKITPTIGNPKV
jgi:amidase